MRNYSLPFWYDNWKTEALSREEKLQLKYSCDDCGCAIYENDYMYIISREYLCHDCANKDRNKVSERYFACDECHEIVPLADFCYKFHSEYYCEFCFDEFRTIA
jgi:hypothetical protein